MLESFCWWEVTSAILFELVAPHAAHVKIFIHHLTIWSSPCIGNTCLHPGFLLGRSLLLVMGCRGRTSQLLVKELNWQLNLGRWLNTSKCNDLWEEKARLLKILQFGPSYILETCTFLAFLQQEVIMLHTTLHRNNWLRKILFVDAVDLRMCWCWFCSSFCLRRCPQSISSG